MWYCERCDESWPFGEAPVPLEGGCGVPEPRCPDGHGELIWVEEEGR